MISWVIIELPPGDFIDVYILELVGASGKAGSSQSMGLMNTEEMERVLRDQYGLNKPTYVRYAKWVWRMFHGDLGNSLEFVKPVTEVVGERLLLTVILGWIAIAGLQLD